METPLPRRSKRQRSPKEDGEIGETAQDVISRHARFFSPGERRLVSTLRKYE